MIIIIGGVRHLRHLPVRLAIAIDARSAILIESLSINCGNVQ